MSSKLNGFLSVPGELNSEYEGDEPLDLNGRLSVQQELTFSYEGNNPLDLNGYLSVQEELTSTFDEPLKLVGHLSIPEYVGEIYDGPYEVTPSGNFILLPTADRILVDDVLVHPIPYTEVSNEQGGITVTIGE